MHRLDGLLSGRACENVNVAVSRHANQMARGEVLHADKASCQVVQNRCYKSLKYICTG